jgi:hypothetical protein
MHDCPSPPPKPFHFHFSLAAIIKLPPNPGVDVAYVDLVCTDEDRANIEELIKSIADNSKFSLLLNQNHLKNIGAQINHVHPLKFLAVAVSSEQLKGHLIQIFDDYFKRNGFMDGLGQSLTREAEKKKIELYLPAFAEEIGVPQESMHSYIQSRDWEGLLQFLMH